MAGNNLFTLELGGSAAGDGFGLSLVGNVLAVYFVAFKFVTDG
jgi:hypothetical protein